MYIPGAPPTPPSIEAQELSNMLDEAIARYREKRQSTTDEDVSRAIALTTSSRGHMTETVRIKLAVVGAMVAILLGLLVFYRLTAG